MSQTDQTIPLARPNIGREEIDAVRGVLESGTLSMGLWTEEFERRIASMIGRAHAVAVSSGTAGLHLAVRAAGIGHGGEVITTPFSFVASANCILYEGATPRFVDIEDETLGLDPDQVEAAANDRTVGILPVHVFGNPCRIEDLDDIAQHYGWHLIEDACEALGSTASGRMLGTFGDSSVFAFYPNKQITTGEGGVVVTDDEQVARLIRSMRNQGRDEDGTWLRHVTLGFNYRMDEISAVIGAVQLARYDELRSGRSRVTRAYEEALKGVDQLTLPQARQRADVDWFVYVVRVSDDIDRDQLISQLGRRGIPSRPYFSPLHLQPLYRDLHGHAPGDFPVTERVAASTLALPFFTTMSEGQVKRVADAVEEAIAEQGSA